MTCHMYSLKMSIVYRHKYVLRDIYMSHEHDVSLISFQLDAIKVGRLSRPNYLLGAVG